MAIVIIFISPDTRNKSLILSELISTTLISDNGPASIGNTSVATVAGDKVIETTCPD